MSKVVIIAEKPDYMRNIAKSLKATKVNKDYMTNSDNSIVVTSLFGHVLELFDVNDYVNGLGNKKDVVKWSEIKLPFIPEHFKYKIKNDKGIRDRLKVIKELIKDATVVVNAGDSDREGQILADNAIQYLQPKCPIKRLWVREQTENEIVKQFQNMEDNYNFKNLYNEGIARVYTDWLYGINLTILASTKTGSLFKIGRVMIPIVKYIYDREMEIRDFVPTTYYQNENEKTVKLVMPTKHEKPEGAKIELNELNGHKAKVVSLEQKEIMKNPPKGFSLNGLQSYLSKKYKMNFSKSMPIIQSLYEKGYISYPRTNTEYFGDNEKGDIENVIKSLSNGELILKNKKSIFDSSKIESHSAIRPTYKKPDISKLSDDEAKVYNTVKNRFFAIFCKESCMINKTEMKIQVGKHEFKLNGEVIKQEGFLKYEPQTINNNLPNLKLGDEFDVDFTIKEKVTTPPSRVSESELARFLEKPFSKNEKENLEKENDDEDYKNILAGVQIGTSATRTMILAKIKQMEYVDLQKGVYSLKPKGEFLINTLNKLNIDLYKEKSIELSVKLKKVNNGELNLDEILTDVRMELLDIMETNTTLEKFKNEEKIIGKCPENPSLDVIKKSTRNGDLYTVNDKDYNWMLFAKCKVMGNDVKLTENQVKNLISGKKVPMTLKSNAGKTYNAYVVLDGVSDKGYVKFKLDGFVNTKEKDSKKTKDKTL